MTAGRWSARVVATYLRGDRVASDGVPDGEPRGAMLGGEAGDFFVDRLNAESRERARDELLTCCGSTEWAHRDGLVPAVSIGGPSDGVRPRGIGGTATSPTASKPTPRTRGSATSTRSGRSSPRPPTGPPPSRPAWPGRDEATLVALAEGNLAYEAKFGHVFLICATARPPARCSPRSATAWATRPRPRGRSPPRSRRRSCESASGNSAHDRLADHDPRPRPRHRPGPPPGWSSSSRSWEPTGSSLGRSTTDADGRARDLPAGRDGLGARGPTASRFRDPGLLPVPGPRRLPPLGRGRLPGRGVGRATHHVPLLLSPFGYSTYRGS